MVESLTNGLLDLNLDKGSGLIEVLRGERDSELGRDEADAALLPPVLRVELLHVGLLLQVVAPRLHLIPASEAGQLWSCTHFAEITIHQKRCVPFW